MAKPDTSKPDTSEQGRVRAGVGGWIYAPWRGVFYPKGLRQADELAYATSHLTSIEINATHYRLQTPKSFKKWADTAPDGFVFSLKGPRLVTQRKVLAETGDFIRRFFASGLSELGDKLGPILWQFPPFTSFDEADFAKFLGHLPESLDARPLNHVVEVRHASFQDPTFIRLLRDHNVSPVFVDSQDYPSIADVTGDVVYARLQTGDDAIDTGYEPEVLDQWAARAKTWAKGAMPDDLPVVDTTHKPDANPRDVFVYFIHEGKLRAPAAAVALIERLD
ncbi:hypothetical protein AUC69_06780 [Methyloceanibacter superfactus]|uniref:DUF72 domain-containing protein n=1 Tax=Methyloceanibacter superfactus TaxID=1774969 RepID=A0A1E3W7F8_9HYPH|nr:DUF72 domain-containing protein [Methyloceanibacter superfactus]ODS01442.1 hypothetical protein AUC69_06780 [Methyloceanibacter superfactus]